VSRRTWVRLDNASNIFLAAMSSVDSKVFRLSAEMAEEVDPELLQQALDRVFDQYVLYHSVLRRGIFWYYLEESDLRPRVVPDRRPLCDHLYHFDRRELLFRVVYHRNRIALEVFHALSDGTGAMHVFRDLVAEYVMACHPDDFADRPKSAPVEHGLERDSFTRYFRQDRTDEFAEAARSASLEAGSRTGRIPDEHVRRAPPIVSRGRRRIHRVRGRKAPDHRTRAVELDMPAEPVLQLARQAGVSVTIFLTALFLQSIREVDERARNATMAISLPVDLRQRFPSNSTRNFFATTRLEYDFGADDESLPTVCRSLNEQLRAQTTPEALEAKLVKLIGFELNPAIRLLPRPLKDVILGGINRFNNRSLTVAISNLGRAGFPDAVDSHVGAVFLMVSAARPQFCMISHAGRLTLTFTSPFVELQGRPGGRLGLPGDGGRVCGRPVMSRCSRCDIEVRGDWTDCPLCGAGLRSVTEPTPAPWPDVPPRFDVGQLLRVLLLVSVLIVVSGLLALRLFFPGPFEGLRLVVFALAALWLVAITAVRKRRNVAKSIVYLVVIACLLSVYGDYLDGWSGWSTTYVIPITCSSSTVALLIAARIARMRPGDYVVYWWLTILIGVVPGLFIALGWVTNPLPSWISVGLSFLMLIIMPLFRGADIQHELKKRLTV